MASQQPNKRRPEGLVPGAHVTAPVLHASIWPRLRPSDRLGTGLCTLCCSLRAPACQLLVFLQVFRSLVQGSHCSSLLPLAALGGGQQAPRPGGFAPPRPGAAILDAALFSLSATALRTGTGPALVHGRLRLHCLISPSLPAGFPGGAAPQAYGSGPMPGGMRPGPGELSSQAWPSSRNRTLTSIAQSPAAC